MKVVIAEIDSYGILNASCNHFYSSLVEQSYPSCFEPERSCIADFCKKHRKLIFAEFVELIVSNIQAFCSL